MHQSLIFKMVLLAALVSGFSLARAETAETVGFDSADGKVKLTGYLYLPDAKAWPAPRPAIVLLHGRSGVFGTGAKRFDATTLSARTAQWGKFWAERGYIGLYVDSFGPRGYHKGFEAGTNKAGGRPPEVNEITVRPHDAAMGLKYLRSRGDVQKDRVFLQGWSNGGSTTLAAMAKPASPEAGFRAAIAVYPACTRVGRTFDDYRPYAPLLLLIGTEDDEVSYAACEKFADASKRAGGDLEFVRYPDAQHAYDAPNPKRAAVPANVRAADDTRLRAEAFFKKYLAPEKTK